MRPYRAIAIAVLALTILPGLVRAADAQQLTSATSAAVRALKVSLRCQSCDHEHLRTALPFVDLVADNALAHVDASLTPKAGNPSVQWTLTVAGRGAFKGQSRTVTFAIPIAATEEEHRAEIARFLALALAPYAAATSAARHLDLTYARDAEVAARKAAADPWHHWVFRIGASVHENGEQSQSSRSVSVSGSANRTTAHWKLRIGGARSLNESAFDVDDLSIRTRLTDWSADALVVRSLGGNLSWGVTSSVTGSTFSNAEMIGRFAPGIEYDVFPYAESSRRSLTIQYTAGYAHYEYREVTIFDRIQEDVGQHQLNVSLGLRQPWGTSGASVAYTQHLQSKDRTRLTATGTFNVRLHGSLSMSGSATYARIRDLFTLPRGGATDEEVLLRLRELDTSFRHSFNVGLSYAIGAVGNTTVNPRFGG
jgi:hypothetical protein